MLISFERVNHIQNTLLLLACCLLLERFSMECRKTKTKALTTANEKKGKSVEPTQLQKARYNAGDRVVIGFGFGFAFDWFNEWREFSRPIRAK